MRHPKPDKDAQIELLRRALIGWMIEHGHRCQICSERSQNALKGIDNDWGHETSVPNITESRK